MNLNDWPKGTTKGEAADALYAGITYDCAIPQSFVDACYQRGFDDAACHFVMLYPDTLDNPSPPYIAPITPRGVEIMARIGTYTA